MVNDRIVARTILGELCEEPNQRNCDLVEYAVVSMRDKGHTAAQLLAMMAREPSMLRQMRGEQGPTDFVRGSR